MVAQKALNIFFEAERHVVRHKQVVVSHGDEDHYPDVMTIVENDR